MSALPPGTGWRMWQGDSPVPGVLLPRNFPMVEVWRAGWSYPEVVRPHALPFGVVTEGLYWRPTPRPVHEPEVLAAFGRERA